MKILYSIEDWFHTDGTKFLTMNWKDARENFMKSSNSHMCIYFEDIEKKGNFNRRFLIWKKVGRFGVDEGVWIQDCRHKRRKEKQICESWNKFPSDEAFLKKYMIKDEAKAKIECPKKELTLEENPKEYLEQLGIVFDNPNFLKRGQQIGPNLYYL